MIKNVNFLNKLLIQNGYIGIEDTEDADLAEFEKRVINFLENAYLQGSDTKKLTLELVDQLITIDGNDELNIALLTDIFELCDRRSEYKNIQALIDSY